jgi:hypothetical protein
MGMRWLLSRLFVLYVALNMLICSIVFFPWALPRETISGLIGRWLMGTGWKRTFAYYACVAVDKLYFWEPNHCAEVHCVEKRAHELLYP